MTSTCFLACWALGFGGSSDGVRGQGSGKGRISSCSSRSRRCSSKPVLRHGEQELQVGPGPRLGLGLGGKREEESRGTIAAT